MKLEQEPRVTQEGFFRDFIVWARRVAQAVNENTDGLAAAIAKLFGIGQTWQTLTGSRAFSTVYTNSTGKPIAVSASVYGTVANSTVYMSWTIGGVVQIGGNGAPTHAVPTDTTITAFAIVPPGVTYQLLVTNAGLNFWQELR